MKNTQYKEVNKMSALTFMERRIKEKGLIYGIYAKDPLVSPFFGFPTAQFFDFPPVWDNLRFNIIPFIVKIQPEGATLKAWVQGASTGQTSYSLAIVFNEVVSELRPHSGITLQITGTDLDSARLEFTKRAIYSGPLKVKYGKGNYFFRPYNNDFYSDRISEERQKRFFIKKSFGRGYQVRDEIRQMVDFRVRDALFDPPLTGNTFVSCSWLIHWLDGEELKKLVRIIFDSLVPNGVWWHLHKVFYRNANFIEHTFS